LATELKPYQKAGRIFRLLAWIQIIGFVAMFVAILIPAISEGKSFFPAALIGLLVFLLPALYMSVGKAIQERKDWGRTVGIILGALMLIGIPIGTLIGGYILYCLISGWDQPQAAAASAAPASSSRGPALRR